MKEKLSVQKRFVVARRPRRRRQELAEFQAGVSKSMEWALRHRELQQNTL
jgi:hypothetical protein